MRCRITIPLALACLAGSASGAQTLPGLPGAASPPGLPDVTRMGTSNVAGVLSYCVKSNLLGSGAVSVIEGLKGKPGVTSSPDYRAGEAGTIIAGSEVSPVSLDDLPANLKAQACEAVLLHGIDQL